MKVYLPDPTDVECCIAIGTKDRNEMLLTTCVVTCHNGSQCNDGLLLQISFLSLLYNTSRARDTRALPRFSYLASL